MTGNARLSIRNILILAIGMLTLLVISLTVQQTVLQYHHLRKTEDLRKATMLSDGLFNMGEKLSMERDLAFFMLESRDDDTIKSLRSDLVENRQQVDRHLSKTLEMFKEYNFPELGVLISDSQKRLAALNELRRKVDDDIKRPHADRNPELAKLWFQDMTMLVLSMQDLWTKFIRHFSDIDPIVTLNMRFKYYLGIITEYTARERSLIGNLLVNNIPPTPRDQADLLQWQGVIDLSWRSAQTLAAQGQLSPDIDPILKDAYSHYLNIYDMMRDIFYVPGGAAGANYPISIELWLELQTQAMDSLYALKDASLVQTQRYIDEREMSERRDILEHIAILLCAIALCIYSFWVVMNRVVRPINDMVEALIGATEGKFVSFLPNAENRQDEIGKLARVLHTFQRNLEQIKRTSGELRRYTRDLERSNKELDDFAYIASHDLKEPLRGIHNHARFLLDDNGEKLDKDSIMRIGRLIYLSQRMERLVNDLLYFSRLGRQEFAFKPTNIADIVHDVESMLDVLLAQNKVKIILTPNLPTIVCDRVRITEVFRNLIVNGIKYNDSAEKVIEVGFLNDYTGADQKPVKNVFYVKDNGHGIAPEFYQEVFRIFRRLENPHNPQEEGTGAGLTFVKKIIERHGGKIWIDSAINKGTTFYFTIGAPEGDDDND